MVIKIYEIIPERDEKELEHMSYDWAEAHGGVDPTIYKCIYDGEIGSRMLEWKPSLILDRFYCPVIVKKYIGRRLSVSDVIEVEGEGCYFCDTVSFVRLDDKWPEGVVKEEV